MYILDRMKQRSNRIKNVSLAASIIYTIVFITELFNETMILYSFRYITISIF